MIENEALEALALHAGGSSDASGPWLADVLWRSRDSVEVPDLDAVWQDVGQRFQALLSEMPGWRAGGIPMACSLAVSEILSRSTHLGLTGPSQSVRERGVLLSWRVSTGWLALVSGCTDDIVEHVRLAEWALQLDATDT